MFLIIYVTNDLKQWQIHMAGDEPAVYTSMSDAQLAAEKLRQEMRDHQIPISTYIVERH